jgi:hypothetical protein
MAYYWGVGYLWYAHPQIPRLYQFHGTLIKIHKLWNNVFHKSWFNECNKMYCMNNTMVLDHHGLSIYLNSDYFSSFNNVITFLWIGLVQKLTPIFFTIFCTCRQIFEYFIGRRLLDGSMHNGEGNMELLFCN